MLAPVHLRPNGTSGVQAFAKRERAKYPGTPGQWDRTRRETFRSLRPPPLATDIRPVRSRLAIRTPLSYPE